MWIIHPVFIFFNLSIFFILSPEVNKIGMIMQRRLTFRRVKTTIHHILLTIHLLAKTRLINNDYLRKLTLTRELVTKITIKCKKRNLLSGSCGISVSDSSESRSPIPSRVPTSAVFLRPWELTRTASASSGSFRPSWA